MRPLVCVILVLAAACRRQPAGGPDGGSGPEPVAVEEHRDEARHETLPTRVRLSPEVVRDARIRTAMAELQSLPSTISLAGEIAADPDLAADVAARTAGRIVEVRVNEGQQVRKGEVLAIVESAGASEARAALASASARARAARENADRLQRLLADGLAAGQEVRSAEAEARALEADANAARGVLGSIGAAAQGGARVELRSPLDGVVLRRNAIRGQSIGPEHVVASVADLRRAYFLARVFEKDLAQVRQAAKAEVRLNAYPDVVLDGEVESVGRQLDPAARTVLARIRVHDDRGLLRVGLYGTANVVQGEGAQVEPRVVVPLDAVTRVAETEAVFVAHADGDFELHPVTLGRSAGGKVEVLSGLRPGEAVVVEGVFSVKSTLLKSTFGEEE